MAAKREPRLPNGVDKVKKKEKKELTLYDLVEEVTGINRNEDEFDSERKKFKTMLNHFQKGKNFDIIEALNNVPKNSEERKKFIGLLKALYYNTTDDGKDLRLIFNKLSQGKSVNQKYAFSFYEPLFDFMRSQTSEEELERFDFQTENFLSKKYYEEVEKVAVELQMSIRKDLAQLEDLLREDLKLELIVDYEKEMNKTLQEWRQRVKAFLTFEQDISLEERRKIACEPNLDYMKMFEDWLSEL